MKNIVNAIDREGRAYTFLQQRFPQISLEQLKAGICDGPQIWVLIKGSMLSDALSAPELSAWWWIRLVITNFPGNKQSVHCMIEIAELLKKYLQLEACMSFKMYLLWSYLDYLPWNCGDLSVEQGECFWKRQFISWNNIAKANGMWTFLQTTVSG